MRLKIAARKSDLARLQAYAVGRAIKDKNPSVEIEYLFSTSLGDQNQNDPLWQMPEKGVFTADLSEKLRAGHCDLVVHSWKDLPTETDSNAETEIAATLPRADARDLLLFKYSKAVALAKTEPLKIYSSSPRRAFNLGAFFSWALPFSNTIEFCSVRGNITTRIEKLLNDDVHGLIVAKAAIDRLLSTSEPEFAESRAVIRRALQQCQFMVLPLSASPAAAAQGALAIEAMKTRDDLRVVLRTINCEKTMREVQNERREFKKFGGGCHQKIGITSIEKPYGRIDYGRGETIAGEIFSYVHLVPSMPRQLKRVSKSQVFPFEKSENSFFRRERIHEKFNFGNHDLWVARAEAWPEEHRNDGRVLWASGLETWRKLAQMKLWVNGCNESLGEREPAGIEQILGRPTDFIKLTHKNAEALPGPLHALGTYRLVPNEKAPDLTGKTQFYWMSFTSFARAVELFPHIIAGGHSCGPGQTFDLIKAELLRLRPHETARLEIYISRESWLKDILL
jgi:hydroxymethylbilane synthase